MEQMLLAAGQLNDILLVFLVEVHEADSANTNVNVALLLLAASLLQTLRQLSRYEL